MIPKPESCQRCPLYSYPLGSKFGLVRVDGGFKKHVLIVGEAAGQQEEEAGLPFIGKAGYYLWNNLKRVGLERDDFRIANVLSCRPPNNKLALMPYEAEAIHNCRPLLDATIRRSADEAREAGKQLVILTLGKTAFKRVTGFNENLHTKLLKLDYLVYPFYVKEYDAWVVAADHPAFLMRGNHHLVSVLQFAALRAVDIAQNGFTPAEEHYICDPDPLVFSNWVNDYLAALRHYPELVLSYDIETLYKQSKDEEQVAREEDPDYTILRCSFAYRVGHAVTVPWRSEYMPALQRIFASGGAKVGWNNENYDNPRIRKHVPIDGPIIDAMLGWHVLNSALPKGLGFVTPYYAKRSLMWKHMSDAEPAWYNAKDADMQLQCWLGIEEDLHSTNLFEVFNSHVIQLNQVFTYMSGQGVQRDEVLRAEAEKNLAGVLVRLQDEMDTVVPLKAKKLKVFKKTPKVIDGLIEVEDKVKVKACSNCGALNVKADHFKSIGKKRLKAGDLENPCAGFQPPIKVETVSKLWAEVESFKLSNKSLQRYQAVQKHKPVLNPKEKRVTFDEKAMLRLIRSYPDDKLYPVIGKYRKHQKLLGTYIGVTNEKGVVEGGLPIGKDGLIHTTFSHNPSTLRSASQNPNLQNLPRPGGPNDPATIIRNLVRARPGHTFLARDFSGIEAVLVGYFAGAKGYVRLSKQDVHSFYTAYALHELDPKRISANDLPQISWDDEKLFKRLAEIKKEFKEDRNSLYKHLVHGANFMQSPRGAAEKIFSETEIEYDVKLVHRVMEIYFELFPEIRIWHKTLLAQADRDGYVRNPFGYVHRFFRVFEWEKVGDQWQKAPGPDANKVIAFGPQSSAAGIIKEAMLRLYFDRFEEAGQFLRLLIHDELFTEVPIDRVHAVDAVLKEEMEKPIKCMPLPPEWGMGEYLNINTEEKIGERWGEMK